MFLTDTLNSTRSPMKSKADPRDPRIENFIGTTRQMDVV